MITSFPEMLQRTIETRWPDYLDIDAVFHSEHCYTIVLLDLDYKYYTFRVNLSLDGRWTVIPLSGFYDGGAWATEGQETIK